MADERPPIRRRWVIQEVPPLPPVGIIAVLLVCAGFAGFGFRFTFLIARSDFEPQRWLGITVPLLFATHMTLIAIGLTLRSQWGWWNAVFSFGLFAATGLYVSISCLLAIRKGAVSDCFLGSIESAVMLGIMALGLAIPLCPLLADFGVFFAQRQGGIPAVGKRDRD